MLQLAIASSYAPRSSIQIKRTGAEQSESGLRKHAILDIIALTWAQVNHCSEIFPTFSIQVVYVTGGLAALRFLIGDFAWP